MTIIVTQSETSLELLSVVPIGIKMRFSLVLILFFALPQPATAQRLQPVKPSSVEQAWFDNYGKDCEAIKKNMLMTREQINKAYAECISRRDTKTEGGFTMCKACSPYDDLMDQAKQVQALAEEINSFRRRGLVATLNCVFPAKIPPARLLSCVGWRTHPRTGKRSFHEGMDVPSQEGELIYAPEDGCVAKLEYSTSFGMKTQFDSKDHTHIFAHQQRANSCSIIAANQLKLRNGKKVCVKKGDPIGCVGNTGVSEGPHIHWEMRLRGMTPVYGVAEIDHVFNAWNEFCDFDSQDSANRLAGEKIRCDETRNDW